jgi:hypothetical protein
MRMFQAKGLDHQFAIHPLPVPSLTIGAVKLTSSRELENLGKAIAEIGEGRSCFAGQIIKEAKEALFKKGYEGAELYGAQLAEADELPRCFEC